MLKSVVCTLLYWYLFCSCSLGAISVTEGKMCRQANANTSQKGNYSNFRNEKLGYTPVEVISSLFNLHNNAWLFNSIFSIVYISLFIIYNLLLNFFSADGKVVCVDDFNEHIAIRLRFNEQASQRNALHAAEQIREAPKWFGSGKYQSCLGQNVLQ